MHLFFSNVGLRNSLWCLRIGNQKFCLYAIFTRGFAELQCVLIASMISNRLGLVVVIFLLAAVLLFAKRRDSLPWAELLIASKCSFHIWTWSSLQVGRAPFRSLLGGLILFCWFLKRPIMRYSCLMLFVSAPLQHHLLDYPWSFFYRFGQIS